MRKFLLALCGLFGLVAVKAQPFGNEWIDYNAIHYKIKVSEDGIYRIPFSVLAGFDAAAGSTPKDQWAVYHNGQQVPIYVSATGNTLTAGDYIDFYGKKNIGDVDSMLYRNGSLQPHPYFSLFTDTSVYYLTRRTAANQRISEIQNNLLNPPAKEAYYISTVRQLSTNGFFDGRYLTVGTDEVYKSLYDEGEGFANAQFFGSINGPGQVSSQTYTLSTPDIVSSGPAAVFRSVYATNSNEGHNVNINFNNNNIHFFSGSKFNLVRVEQNIALSQLNNGNNTVQYSTVDNATSFRQNVVYLNEISYPRDFNFQNKNNFYFIVAADANKKYIEVNNFNDNGQVPVLYDITNGLLLRSTQPAGSSPLRFVLPPSSKARELVLFSGDATSFKTVNTLEGVVFENLGAINKQGDYVIISNPALYDLNGSNPVEAYRAYRDIDDNITNGKFQAVTVNVEALYDQFSYGVRKSPLALRNFIQWANATWGNKPRYVFLAGKAIEAPALKRATGNQFNLDLVPTFGYPGSDNLLAASRTNDSMVVAIGRLAAQTPQQVQDYLTKMTEYEDQQIVYHPGVNPVKPSEWEWQKKVLHFGGGTGSTEQVIFRSYLERYADTVQAKNWGANVEAFYKETNAPIDQSKAAIIKGEINEGVSLITFFGHSATSAFDFSIDEPENYTNFGKYPVIISNGCFAGLIHSNNVGFSERFVFPSDKGAIAFMATTSLSISTNLDHFTSFVYGQLSQNNYTKPFGDCVRGAFNRMVNCCGNADYDMMVAYEMTIHGDPALQLNQYAEPDYAIEQSSVFFNPSTVTPASDSFEVKLVVTNLGRAIDDSVSVTMTRTVFDASNSGAAVPFFYKKIIAAPYYKDTVTFVMPTQVGDLGYGENQFTPFVDADYEINEMTENNNGLTIPVSIIIQSDEVIPIYPYEFAIDSQQGITLKASTVNPFAPYRDYTFQIDTSELFLNPLETGHIAQVGGVLHWNPSLTFKDSTVYYWRVSITGNAKWRYSSFIYLAHEYPGWNQSHLYQWEKDEFLNIILDSTDRLFKFPPSVNNIYVKTGIADAVGGTLPSAAMGWNYNNYDMHRYRMGSCGFTQGLTFAVIDNVTGLPWYSLNQLPSGGDNWGDKFGNYHCLGKYYLQYGYDFATLGTHSQVDPSVPSSALISNKPWSEVIKNFIDSIPNGFYVLVYSDNNMTNNYINWDTTLVAALTGLDFPALTFKSGQINSPFIYFTQKGNSAFPSTLKYHNDYTPIDASIDFTGLWYQGQFTTPKIGPAMEWGSMHFKLESLEGNSKDTSYVDVIGVTNTGLESVLFSTINPDNLLNTVSAQQYPYLRLRMHSRDDSLRTPAQLKYWRILYKKAPEAAINPAAHFTFTDNVPMGGDLKLEVALESITDQPMDSILTKYTIRDAQFNNYASEVRHSPLPGLDTLILSYTKNINSNTYEGLDKIIVEANPHEDQIEQYHFNNFAELNFNTAGDKINPLLDVTFDGQHIFNGDIVSAKPNILITLKDENKFLALNDTSLISVYLKYPGETEPVRINFDDVIMKFYPADSTNLASGNRAQIEFKPTLQLDGKYELIIKDRDRSNNHSSNVDRYEGFTFYDYKIGFEVINKPMITNVLNYPNPFTTATKFIFTITGSEIPDYMRIQIMTIKGTVVKEIKKEELGPLHIGRNISEYTWDGRDEYGDVLANGVYFYRVSTRLDDKNMDHMSQNYDKYFKKGFGKLVIIR